MAVLTTLRQKESGALQGRDYPWPVQSGYPLPVRSFTGTLPGYDWKDSGPPKFRIATWLIDRDWETRH